MPFLLTLISRDKTNNEIPEQNWPRSYVSHRTDDYA